jgi:hypothetical protein
MSSHQSPTRQLEVDLMTITVLNRILEKDTDPTLQPARERLAEIVELLKNPAHIGMEATLQLLPDFLHSYPDLLTRAINENAREIIEKAQETLAFISSELNYYEKIKRERPLTCEEKNICVQLGQLLDRVQGSLQ